MGGKVRAWTHSVPFDEKAMVQNVASLPFVKPVAIMPDVIGVWGPPSSCARLSDTERLLARVSMPVCEATSDTPLGSQRSQDHHLSSDRVVNALSRCDAGRRLEQSTA